MYFDEQNTDLLDVANFISSALSPFPPVPFKISISYLINT